MAMPSMGSSIEHLIQYKKSVLGDERRDSRIRQDIEATLDFLTSRRNSDTSNNDHIPRSVAQSDTTDFAFSLVDIEKNQMHRNANYSPHLDEPFKDADLTWKQRLKHFTWAWYTSTMSTGGVALVLANVPHRFDVLGAIGAAMFVFNVFLFITLTALMILRFKTFPETFKPAFTNAHEGFFFATFWLSFATMMTNSVAYAVPNTGPWLIEALKVAFWIYTFCVTVLAIVYYYILFTVHKLVITNVLPGWILPIFPAMLVGTLAGAISKLLTPEEALPMLVAGLAYQGLGFLVALMMYPLYFGRLLTSGLPADMSRPAMFIGVGPPAFTGLAFIGMAKDVKTTKIFESYTTLDGIVNQALIADSLSLLALLMAIFLWVFAFWMFALAVIAAFEAVGRNDFHLNWYAYVFPNVGFTIVTIRIGERLDSPSINVVGTLMSGILFFTWILIVYCHVKAVRNKMILWPGKDEDAAH